MSDYDITTIIRRLDRRREEIDKLKLRVDNLDRLKRTPRPIEVSGYTLIPCTYRDVTYYEVYYKVDNTEVFGTLMEEHDYNRLEKYEVDLFPIHPINLIGEEELELWKVFNRCKFIIKDNLQDIWDAIEKHNNNKH